VVASKFLGAVVVSQSCDISRPFADRPHVKVCPAVEVNEKVFGEILRHMRPAFALVPESADRRLVADLDRIMTVEKAVIAACERIPGCRTDAEAYAFADALARNVRRPALPDDVGPVMNELREHINRKHGKNSEEGAHLRALAEIRVRARPLWDADTVYMTFYFIKEEEPRGFAPNWEAFLEGWREKIAPTERFKLLGASVVTLSQMNALHYTQSVHLDLDRLSARRE